MYALIKKLAQVMAVLGGLVLTLLVLLVCTSVLGRSVGTLLHSAFMQTNFTEFLSKKSSIYSCVNIRIYPIIYIFKKKINIICGYLLQL